MEWLNLSTADLDSPEFVGADPVARATWLCLLRYCVGQENGGRIVACRGWKDRKWQQVVRVTQKEVEDISGLWAWDGDDLVVAFYPIDQESKVQSKRTHARTIGRLGGRPRLTQPDLPTNGIPVDRETRRDGKPTGREAVVSETSEKPTQVSNSKPSGNLEETYVGFRQVSKTEPTANLSSNLSENRKGKERKEKEMEGREIAGAREGGGIEGAALVQRLRAIIATYPVNGSEYVALRALVDAKNAGEDIEFIAQCVGIHAERWRALPPAQRRFCPGKDAYFGAGRWRDNPDEHPWRLDGAPGIGGLQPAPVELCQALDRLHPAWAAAPWDIGDLEALSRRQVEFGRLSPEQLATLRWFFHRTDRDLAARTSSRAKFLADLGTYVSRAIEEHRQEGKPRLSAWRLSYSVDPPAPAPPAAPAPPPPTDEERATAAAHLRAWRERERTTAPLTAAP